MEDKNIDNELFNPEEMQSPFESIKEVDAEGHEWWNSRKLARLMGYMKYWNFERLMDKVAVLQLSTAIKKFLIPSDNCDDTGTILYNLDAIIAVGYRVNSYTRSSGGYRIRQSSQTLTGLLKDLKNR